MEKDERCLVKLERPPTFSGVGGSLSAPVKISIWSPGLNAGTEPFVMPDTPDVISIGKRCVEEGWSF